MLQGELSLPSNAKGARPVARVMPVGRIRSLEVHTPGSPYPHTVALWSIYHGLEDCNIHVLSFKYQITPMFGECAQEQ